VLTKLAGIAKVARERPQEKFTSLAHLINEEMLTICHAEMDGKKAAGVDAVTKQMYGENLERNLRDLVQRMKRHAYRPQPARRTYIPKPGTSKQRPLGIPAYEDKLVQAALAKILTAIYEQEFLESSFGFRPNRSCHDAIKVLNVILIKRPINYIVDVDIKGFFDHVNHEWMVKFIEHRIKDPNIIRLIKRFLKAGIMEEGIKYETTEGTPQGGLASPVLANIYLHYVIDLWFEKCVRTRCRGAAFMVRYADDNAFCFENEEEADAFYRALPLRLNKFGLEISTEKSKIIAFGRNASKSDDGSNNTTGDGKPETFDFLGFKHYCSKSRNGKFRVKRKTSGKKFRASLLRFKSWIQENRHMLTEELMKKLRRKLQGYYQYYGITDNIAMLRRFLDEVKRHLLLIPAQPDVSKGRDSKYTCRQFEGQRVVKYRQIKCKKKHLPEGRCFFYALL
jgi:group II intron reverse transcriptase/maturase